IVGHKDPGPPAQAFGGGYLVVITGFPECCAAWHDNNGLRLVQGGNDRSHASMGDNQLGILEQVAELSWMKECLPLEIGRTITLVPGHSNLAKNVLPPGLR